MKIKSFQTDNPTDLLPESGKSLIGFYDGNFCYIKNNEDVLRIRCHFEKGNAKTWIGSTVKPSSIGRLLELFNYDWKKATWLIH